MKKNKELERTYQISKVIERFKKEGFELSKKLPAYYSNQFYRKSIILAKEKLEFIIQFMTKNKYCNSPLFKFEHLREFKYMQTYTDEQAEEFRSILNEIQGIDEEERRKRE